MNVKDTIMDVEGAIRFLQKEDREKAMFLVKKIFHQYSKGINKLHNKEEQIIKKLNKKLGFYLKADKGNKLVIIDRTTHENLALQKRNIGNFFKLRTNPLPDSIKRVEKTLREFVDLVKNSAALRMPNPSLPRFRIQPKVHKNGNETWEIIADTNSPTYNIAKWLLQEVNAIGDYRSKYAVKNSFQVVEKLKDTKIRQHEILVSFDVKALFPSIPVKQALHKFETWLNKHRTSTKEKRENRQYTKLASICMNENYFTFRRILHKLVNVLNKPD